jgi:hypothetical protein
MAPDREMMIRLFSVGFVPRADLPDERFNDSGLRSDERASAP